MSDHEEKSSALPDVAMFMFLLAVARKIFLHKGRQQSYPDVFWPRRKDPTSAWGRTTSRVLMDVAYPIVIKKDRPAYSVDVNISVLPKY